MIYPLIYQKITKNLHESPKHKWEEQRDFGLVEKRKQDICVKTIIPSIYLRGHSSLGSPNDIQLVFISVSGSELEPRSEEIMCDTFKREFRCRNLWTDASDLADYTSSTVS